MPHVYFRFSRTHLHREGVLGTAVIVNVRCVKVYCLWVCGESGCEDVVNLGVDVAEKLLGTLWERVYKRNRC